MLVLFEVVDLSDLVFVEEEGAEVRILVNVFNTSDLVVRQISPFKSCWRIKIKHLSQLIRACIKSKQVL